MAMHYTVCLLFTVICMIQDAMSLGNSMKPLLLLTRYATKLVTVVPVADLTYKTVQNKFGTKHQLLFNEQAEIIKQRDNELLVRISNMFYVGQETKNKATVRFGAFWAQKDSFVTLDELKKEEVNVALFPRPIQWSDGDIVQANRNVVTLTMPFYDRETKRTFSTGTRFVPVNNEIRNNDVNVWAFDKKSFRLEKIDIPKKLCLLNQPETVQKQRSAFVSLTKQWTNYSIPYLLGGCSFVAQYKRVGCVNTPRTGFDCSGVILRAAQICNIPYFFKNSATLAHHLSPVTTIDDLEPGDLLFFRGHVLIASDIENNMIIESRGHASGFGKLHELPLNKLFKEIETWEDVWKAHTTQQPLFRLNSKGKVTKKITNIKLLKLILKR